MPGRADRRVVCLGEALVDFVCERPVAALTEADAFVPRLGGSLANIAVAAARFGARAELLGGAGDDEWGRWLRTRLSAEGVGVERFLFTGSRSSHAFVSVDAGGEPSFSFHAAADRSIAAAGEQLDAALGGDPGILVVGSDTLLADDERELTMRAATVARERGWEVLCDPNLRPRRWPGAKAMLATVNAVVDEATLLKCNRHEALVLSGEDEVERAARTLLGGGAEAVVVTRGAEGALLATGERIGHVEASAAAVGVVDATGAGDCVAGVIAAGLAAGAPVERLGPVLTVAMEAAAGVVSRWGAASGLPPAGRARTLLAAALG